MYAIHVLLSFYIHSLCGPLTGAAAQAVPSAQLLPDGFSAFGNFEVLSTHEDGDEDVVRIRKRANDPEDCDENDCLTYSGWAEEGKVGNSFVDDMQGDFADPLEKRSQLEERSDPKTGTPPCKDIWFDGNPAPGIPIYSLEWPTPSSKIDDYKAIYDTGDPTQPDKIEWFQLTRRDKRWTKDIVQRKSKSGKNLDRQYDIEHVLEWQVYKMFLDADKWDTKNGLDKRETNYGSRCQWLYKFFLEDWDLVNDAKMPVKVAKDKEKLPPSGKFEMVNGVYDWSGWNLMAEKKPLKPRLIDWVGLQWPGKSYGKSRPLSPWQYELTLMYHDGNAQKAQVWGDNNIFPIKQMDKVDKELDYVKKNSLTLEARFGNVYYDDKKPAEFKDNMGKCKAVHMYGTVMSVAAYHNDAFVKEVMLAQIRRVGDAWEDLEQKLLNWKGKGPKVWTTSQKRPTGNQLPPDKQSTTYAYQNFRKQWFDWIDAHHTNMLTKLQKALDDNLKIFEGNAGIKVSDKVKVKRWDYMGVFSRANPGEEFNCGSEPNDAAMAKRVTNLVKAKNQMTKVVTKLGAL